MITSTIQTIIIIVIRPMPNPFYFSLLKTPLSILIHLYIILSHFAIIYCSIKENKVYKIELDDMNDNK